MIYFDNAASGFFKPSKAIDAAIETMKALSVNSGRSAHRLAVEAERKVFYARKFLSKTFNNGAIERVIFTSNCTEALNTAIFGMPLRYGEIVTSVTEHNSVLRPLYHLQDGGVEIKFAKFSDKPFIQAKDLLPLVTKKTDMVVLNAVSNVTGYKNEFREIGARLKELGIPLVVDGAQAGGHISIDMKRDNVDCLCLAGHKGLYSVQGVGVLIFNEKTNVSPLKYGGSGTESFLKAPTMYPEMLEAGTLNLPAIVSLHEGAKYAYERVETTIRTLTLLTEKLINGLSGSDEIEIYSEKNPFGIVSFAHKKYDSISLSRFLSDRYDIAVRGGFHCAPKIHEALFTEDCGLIRASLSPFNDESEINEFLKIILSL